MITKEERRMQSYARDQTRSKKLSSKKLNKKVINSFKKLNNKKCYKFFDDKTSKTYHNLLDFLSLIEKKCEDLYGDNSKYSKKEVGEALQEIFTTPTEKECKTLNKINKFLKKTNDKKMVEFKFERLFKGKKYEDVLGIPKEMEDF